MSDKLRNFLNSLAENPEMLEKFKENPHHVMDKHELTDEHKNLVLEGDREKLKRATGADDSEVSKFIV